MGYKILPSEDMSYQATSFIIPPGNGLPAVDISVNDPAGWVQQQLDKRDSSTQLGAIEQEKQREDKVIQEIRQQMQDILRGSKSGLDAGVSAAQKKIDAITGGIGDSINPLNKLTDIAKGAGYMLVLILVGTLSLAFGIWQLTKD